MKSECLTSLLAGNPSTVNSDTARYTAEPPSADQSTFGRRELLLRAGAVGAGAMVAGLWPLSAKADVPPALEPLLRQIAEPAIDLLVHDTYAGLAVFAVPGPDRYSRAQGLTSATPGGVEARSPDLIQHTLDFYISWPDAYLHALAAAFREGVSDVPLPRDLLSAPLLVLEAVGAKMDDALKLVLANDMTVPASLPLALLMNFAATQVRPSSVIGPTPSPFANLKWHEKGLAFQRIEQANAELVALIDKNAPQPAERGGLGTVALCRRHHARARGVRDLHRVARVRPPHQARDPAAAGLGPQQIHAGAHDAGRRLGGIPRLLRRPHRSAHRAGVRRTVRRARR
jgi:hypothetical protein